MCNMYTQSTMRVTWNDSSSDSFPLLNGVKQDAVLSSPIPFTVDVILERLKLSGVGRHAGTFGYAEDVALLTTSLVNSNSFCSIDAKP